MSRREAITLLMDTQEEEEAEKLAQGVEEEVSEEMNFKILQLKDKYE